MTIINREEIPEAILDEISNCYKTVTFEHYGKPVTKECVSRKIRYQRFIAENVQGIVLDNVTFEPITITGTEKEGYIVRGIFSDDSADIYSVISVGNYVENIK
jgi:hypothetical protein